MDPHIRDNFLAVGPHLIARKASDQSVTSSIALVDCTTMTLAVAANEVWQFVFNVIYTGATTGDIRLAFTFPASGRIDANAVWAGAGGTVQMNEWSGTTTPTTAVQLNAPGTTTHYFLPITGLFTNAGTAGNLQLQFAQGTSDATATTVFTHSTVWAVKLA
jgi:hypothetical protein